MKSAKLLKVRTQSQSSFALSCLYEYDCMCMRCVDQDMDGEAVTAALASNPGPDCLKRVLPKLGPVSRFTRLLKIT